jgi:four helix bundle protein
MMSLQLDHEKLRAYQEALRFVGWADAIIEGIPAKIAARDQLDRASTSTVLNLAEGNGKRSHAERCRYFDTARGSGVERAACLDVLRAKNRITEEQARAGKEILLGVVAMTAGLIARFSGEVREEQAHYARSPGAEPGENENDYEER